MKKLTLSLAIVLAIALTLKIAGSILLGVQPPASGFNMAPLANSLSNIGWIAGALSGIALVVVVIVNTIKSDEKK